MAIQKLSTVQKERVMRLENQLARACSMGNLESARAALYDLKPIYLETGNNARYYIANLRYFESMLDFGDKNNALIGFKGIRERSNKNTRVWLEASSLLAIGYLRIGSFELAENIIKDVLLNDTVIKSEKKRSEFRKEIISRFDEEALIFGLSENYTAKPTVEEIEKEIVKNIGQNNDEIYESIGKIVPQSAKGILLRVDSFSKKQLPTAERLALPSGNEEVENKKIGKRIQNFISRSLYNSFCDKESEVYKYIVSGKLTNMNTIITAAIMETFYKFNIGISALIGYVASIIIKFGIDYICNVSKPKRLIEFR